MVHEKSNTEGSIAHFFEAAGKNVMNLPATEQSVIYKGIETPQAVGNQTLVPFRRIKDTVSSPDKIFSPLMCTPCHWDEWDHS